jgi:hypothetical protein
MKIKTYTIAQLAKKLSSDELILPGVQRHFVWSTKQIYDLFDSIMCGYPIGTVLVWRTRPADNPKLVFRRLVQDYTGQGTQQSTIKPQQQSLVSAVLDGQQRLTAINLALNGSFAGSPTAPKRWLYLNLDDVNETSGADESTYEFEFLAPGSPSVDFQASGVAWFPVYEAVGRSTGVDEVNALLDTYRIERSLQRRMTLTTLISQLNYNESISEHQERGDLDRVLNIFARTNTGGTKLTYSELLVSTVTAKWQKLDADAAISALKRDMNRASGEGFRFTPDRIVKAGLVLSDVKEPKFKVQSFMKGDKAAKLESIWPEFSTSMVIAAELLASFGLSGSSLSGTNAVIPVAYYIYRRALKHTYVTAHAHEVDRKLVRAFVARTLLQRAYWTGAVDQILTSTRHVIKEHGGTGFPLSQIEGKLSASHPITVTEKLLDELSTIQYGDRRTGALLRLLFPHMVTKAKGAPRLEKDHIYPRAKVTASNLTRCHIPSSDLAVLAALSEQLPNVQLLDKADNGAAGKGASWPKDWLTGLSPTTRSLYSQQYVTGVGSDLSGFKKFHETRRKKLRSGIEQLLIP